MITRVPRRKNNASRNQILLTILYILLTIIVCVCIVIIVRLSSTINNSIKSIEDETQAIASGDLSRKIPYKTLDMSKRNEITSISESLEKMRLSLAEAQNQKTKFIMGISHDLRTPVSVIKGYTEAISDGVLTSQEEVKKSAVRQWSNSSIIVQ